MMLNRPIMPVTPLTTERSEESLSHLKRGLIESEVKFSSFSSYERSRPLKDPVAKTTMWFVNEEMVWRTGASLIWQSALMVPTLFTYILCSTLVSWHPICWISEILQSTTSLRFVFYTILLQLLVASLGHIYTSATRVFRPIHANRLEGIKFMLRPKCCVKVLHFMLIGLGCASTFLKVRNLQVIDMEEDTGGPVLHEQAFFLICLGTFTGLLEGIVFFREGKFCISIPRVQEPLIFRIKSALASCFIGILTESLQILRNFYIIYYFLGSRPRELVVFAMNLETQNDSVPLTSVLGLIDVWLFMEAITLALTLKFIFRTSNALYHIFMSQNYCFPVEATFADDVGRTIKDAICSPNELLKSLAALDLLRVSQQKCKRRKQLFMLSQPGGKPVTWTAIKGEYEAHTQWILQLLKEALNHERLTAYKPQGHERILRNGKGTPNFAQSPAPSPYSRTNASTPGIQEVTTEQVERSRGKEIFKENRKNQFLLADYFLKKDPDLHFKLVSNTLDFSVSVIEGFSCIVSASITEDEYGVVQKDLSDIVTVFLKLHEAVESLLRIKGKSNRNHKQKYAELNPSGTLRALMKLKLATETALYRISTAFGSHLRFLKLPVSMKNTLDNFVEIKQ